MEDYLNLITSEHIVRPKFMSVLETYLTPLAHTLDVFDQWDELFDLDTAQGSQLDIIGEIVGANRILPFQPSDGTSSVMNDDDYRFYIKAKILQNHWDGTRLGLEEIWISSFPDAPLQIEDHADMSVTITATFLGVSDLQLEMVENGLIFPRPAGVLYNYTIIKLPAFAYDQDTEVYKGYDEGTWMG